MFPSSVRIAVALVLFILGTFLMSFGRLEGLFMVVAALYWLFTYLRFGPVRLAFRAYRTGDLAKAAQLVDEVRWPGMLSPRYRGYYHWIKGAVAAHAGEIDVAYEHYMTAKNGRLQQTSDRSVIAALLAELELLRGHRSAAREHLAEARSLEHRPDLDAYLDELEARASRK